jgi:hypothetical protein
MDVAISVHGVPIRLTDERWTHIERGHPEMAGRRSEILNSVSTPDMLVRGNEGTLLAVRRSAGGMLVVVAYRETSATDGFVLTAFVTRRDPSRGRDVVWTSP